MANGAPAEAAGLKEGDVVLGINKSFGRSLQQLKTELQNAGNKIKIIITRDGNLQEYEFKIKSILH